MLQITLNIHLVNYIYNRQGAIPAFIFTRRYIMEIKQIVNYINRSFIASDYLREPDVYYYMDLVIDDINERLQAKFPTFTEWKDFVAAWNAHVAGPNPVPGEGLPEGTETETEEPVETTHVHPHPVVGYPHLPIYPGQPPQHPGMFLRDNTKYDAFPDKYLRSVVALGAAVKFYTRDEEGEQIALDYQNRYERALFIMVRDYHNQVPWYFQENTGGYIDFSYNREQGPWDLNPRGVVLDGYDTRVL